MTDPIADLLTRIRNAYLVNKRQVILPYSKMKQSLAGILQKSGYLEAVSTSKNEASHKTLVLKLRYIHKLPAVTSIDRLSKPGRRVYVRSDQIRPVLSGKGLSIISTSRGIMTGVDARKQRIGGELICRVW